MHLLIILSVISINFSINTELSFDNMLTKKKIGLSIFIILLLVIAGFVLLNFWPVNVEEKVETARQNFENENFKQAVNYYEIAVNNWDDNFNFEYSRRDIENELTEAKEMRVNNLLAEVEQYIKKNKFDMAREKLNKADQYNIFITRINQLFARLKEVEAEDRKIEVDIEVSKQKLNDDSLLLEFDSNLPDDMRIKLFLVTPDGKQLYQTEKNVEELTVNFTTLSDKSQPYYSGEYNLKLRSQEFYLQPDSVKEFIGQDGKNLQGEYVRNGRFEANLPVIIDEVDREIVEERKVEIYKFNAVYYSLHELKQQILNKMPDDDINEFESQFNEWERNLNNIVRDFERNFGSDLNEFTGYYSDIFQELQYLYGDLDSMGNMYHNYIKGEFENNIDNFINRLRENFAEMENEIIDEQELFE